MMEPKKALQRKAFFFAEAAAGMYDLTIGMVVPYYAIMHDFILTLLRTKRLSAGDVILDVGSGTGTDSLSILTTFPKVHVVSMDLCEPIQRVHYRKLSKLDNRHLRLRERSKTRHRQRHGLPFRYRDIEAIGSRQTVCCNSDELDHSSP